MTTDNGILKTCPKKEPNSFFKKTWRLLTWIEYEEEAKCFLQAIEKFDKDLVKGFLTDRMNNGAVFFSKGFDEMQEYDKFLDSERVESILASVGSFGFELDAESQLTAMYAKQLETLFGNGIRDKLQAYVFKGDDQKDIPSSYTRLSMDEYYKALDDFFEIKTTEDYKDWLVAQSLKESVTFAGVMFDLVTTGVGVGGV